MPETEVVVTNATKTKSKTKQKGSKPTSKRTQVDGGCRSVKGLVGQKPRSKVVSVEGARFRLKVSEKVAAEVGSLDQRVSWRFEA